jgi:hypothetical protein
MLELGAEQCQHLGRERDESDRSRGAKHEILDIQVRGAMRPPRAEQLPVDYPKPLRQLVGTLADLLHDQTSVAQHGLWRRDRIAPGKPLLRPQPLQHVLRLSAIERDDRVRPAAEHVHRDSNRHHSSFIKLPETATASLTPATHRIKPRQPQLPAAADLKCAGARRHRLSQQHVRLCEYQRSREHAIFVINVTCCAIERR